MTLTFILAALSALGLFVSVALIPLRMGAARSGTAAPAGGGWWVLAIVAIGLWCFTVSHGLKANAKSETAKALAQLQVVNAAEILRAPDDWLNVPVVITDVAACAEKMADPDAGDALATRVKMWGEDEIEGEENDYIDTVQYGVEEDVVKFTLGGADSKLRVDDEGWTVVPAGPATSKQIDSGEFSAAKGGNLMDVEERRSIPCGATVSVAGIVTKEGDHVLLDNLPKSLAILTDRPWADIVGTAKTRATHEVRGFFVWLIFAAIAGLAQLAGAVMARGKA